jgi:L-aminopeptidase/D-esterase-like protein
VTNAKLTKSQANKLASIAHNGYARAIRPVHTMADGDTIFVMATGEVEVMPDAVGALATDVMARAINRAARSAEPAYGLKAARDFE